MDLVRREFQLLKFFLRHPNQTYASESLIENIWGRDSDVSAEAARVAIKRLRTKLNNEPGSTEVIENIYGVGYRLRS